MLPSGWWYVERMEGGLEVFVVGSEFRRSCIRSCELYEMAFRRSG
ncbi:hypothetical protein LINGRAHAP2_LOCUS320 [Linum grandiflorum]